MACLRRSSGLVLAAFAALLAGACLPTDTRDPPGELIVSASPDAASTQGFTTDDGWSISYRRFLVVLGGVLVFGEDCSPYNQGTYNRILDTAAPSPQRLSLVYGLGVCRFSFRIVPPNENTIRGSGVSEADETFLRTPGSDGRSEGAISVFMEGTATGAAGMKHFSWSFRSFIHNDDCFVPPDGTPEAGVTLSAGQSTLVDIAIRGAALFRQAPEEPVGPLRFEPFREADDIYGDADGTVTLDELDSTPLPPEAEPIPPVHTLGDRVYLELLPTITRFQGEGSCVSGIDSRGPDFER